LKLVTVPSSPFGRKVAVVASELGLLERLEVLHDNPWKPETQVPRFNPVGKVPVLLADDGLVVYGSSVICEYLESLVGGHRLFPETGPARWHALRRQELADQAMEAFVAVRLERNRAAGEQSPNWIKRKLGVLARCLDAIDAEDLRSDEAPTIGDVATAVLVGHLDFRRAAADDDWRPGRARLAAWYDMFAQRPSMMTTHPHD
jgi:glutathione S-transferase